MTENEKLSLESINKIVLRSACKLLSQKKFERKIKIFVSLTDPIVLLERLNIEI